MIPALVLTAGLATRLRPLSLVRAKAALPVGREPLVRRILRQLADASVADVVLNLHHLPESIARVVGDGADLGLRVRYSWENPVLGSAGGPRRALPLLARTGSGLSSTFLILNGDTLTNVDIGSVVEAHRQSGASVTMAVIPNTEPGKYGGALVDAGGAITGFVRRGSTQPSYHVIGVQVAEAAAFADVPENVPFETVLALYPSLIAAKPGAVRAHVSDAEFFDIGTATDYLATALLLAERYGEPTTGARPAIHPTARIERSILWDDIAVEEGVMLKDCVVADGVRVPADTSWHGVSLRVATDTLVDGEKRYGNIAIRGL